MMISDHLPDCLPNLRSRSSFTESVRYARTVTISEFRRSLISLSVKLDAMSDRLISSYEKWLSNSSFICTRLAFGFFFSFVAPLSSAPLSSAISLSLMFMSLYKLSMI